MPVIQLRDLSRELLDQIDVLEVEAADGRKPIWKQRRLAPLIAPTRAVQTKPQPTVIMVNSVLDPDKVAAVVAKLKEIDPEGEGKRWQHPDLASRSREIG